jgi:hypothetical protein
MEFLGNKIVLTCRQGSCCPILEKVSEDEYTLSDDYNNVAKIRKEHLSLLKQAIEHFEKTV